MPSAADQVSLESLLAFISKYTGQHFRNTGRRTDGAVLAEAIRGQFPGFSYDHVGLARLSDAVRLAEERGLVVRHRDVKHLELSPGRSSDVPAGAEVTAHAFAPLPHVRPEVWRAFVFVSREDHCFFDRNTGQVVVVGADDSARRSSLTADDRYVTITPIPGSTQQEWMETFVRDREPHVAHEAPIRVAEWWLQFSSWLRDIDPGLEKEWNRVRTSKVLEYLRGWASDKQVPLEQLLSPQPRVQKRAVDSLSRYTAAAHASESAALRRAVLAAVSDMSLEELGQIALPVRYIARHFKPR